MTGSGVRIPLAAPGLPRRTSGSFRRRITLELSSLAPRFGRLDKPLDAPEAAGDDRPMFDALRHFLGDLAGAGESGHFAVDDYRVAAAALLVSIVNIDGVVEESERAALHDVLKTRFGL